jgi:choline dehydrogenase-like flavoprotein
MANQETVDILIVGSGMGGATLAAGLAPTGVRILIVERGKRLRDSADARDARAIFQRGVFRPDETWLDGAGQPFNPGNYYYVGGSSKLYGAVLLRYRAQDFAPVVYRDGATPGWPFSYEELEPWYGLAEKLYNVRGAIGFDPTEPKHSAPYPFGPVPDEPAIGKVRERLKRVGLHPFPLPLRRRHRQMAQARENAVGRLPRHGDWQDGRRDLRPRQGSCLSQCRVARKCSRRAAAYRS